VINIYFIRSRPTLQKFLVGNVSIFPLRLFIAKYNEKLFQPFIG